jgi:proteasome lid subunit RPN8/RPN11
MEQVFETENNLVEVLNFFKKYSTKYFNTECCGFLGKRGDKFVGQMVDNRSPEPDLYFCVDPIDFVKFSENHDVIAIFHSHINNGAIFSEEDKNASESICIPYLLYSIMEKKFVFYIPENHEVDVKILDKVKGLI